MARRYWWPPSRPRPSREAVHDFVNDPDYRPLKELRLRITTNANAVLAPEFEWPDSQD
jgi:hypothetical protein